MIITALAGPLSNLALAILTGAVMAAIMKFAPHLLGRTVMHGALRMLLRAMMFLNVGLFIFNLVPLPPLDGSRLLPRSMDGFVEAVSPYSFFLLLVIFNIGILYQVLILLPVSTVMGWIDFVFQLRGGFSL